MHYMSTISHYSHSTKSFPLLLNTEATTYLKCCSTINTIVVHHSASNVKTYGPTQIRADHLKRGFSDIGYHYVIDYDANIVLCRRVDIQPAANGKDLNSGTIAICLLGNSRQTHAQLNSLRLLISCINTSLKQPFNPAVIGHRNLKNTICPGFDATRWYYNGS